MQFVGIDESGEGEVIKVLGRVPDRVRDTVEQEAKVGGLDEVVVVRVHSQLLPRR